MDADVGPSGDDARRREPGSTADSLDEPDAVVANFRVVPNHLELDTGDGDVREAEIEGRRADEPLSLVRVTDDFPVLDLDRGDEMVRLAEPVLGAQTLEVTLLEVVGRRLVVLRDAELERQLRHAFDRVRRDPGDRSD
jgi:hypothetical protein